MKELKCPKCGNVFKVDEADYAAIVGNTIGEHGDFLAVYLAADGKADDVLTYL